MFLGAGSSRSAGIKTAGDMIWDFKQRLYRSQKKLPPSAITDIGEPAVQRKLQAHFACVAAFAEKMRSVREHVAQSKKLSYKYQKEAWLLDALEIYCVAVSSLFAEAKLQRPSSPGFAGLLGYLADYVDSTGFRELSGDITSLKVQLASIRYDLLIDSGAVTVTRYNEEPDYEAEIQDDFEKFKQGDVSDYLFKFSDFVGMNHIEAGVLERVGRLFPDIFAALDAFVERHSDALDATICRFDREVQFYISYIEYMWQFQNNGLRFCTPFVSNEDKKISACKAFDVGLAKALVDRKLNVVTRACPHLSQASAQTSCNPARKLRAVFS